MATTFAWAKSPETMLLNKCSGKDLLSCEKLATFYVQNQNWNKALLVGDALCIKEVAIGCTYKGLALLKNKNLKGGIYFLNIACDKFEPYSCRLMGRLMSNSGKRDLSHVYFRQACHFGLHEICHDIDKNRKFLSTIGSQFMKSILQDCSETKLTSCSDRLAQIRNCQKPFSQSDCELIPGLLNIFFRSKLLQAEAKLLLSKILISEKNFKNNLKNKRFTTNLFQLFKDSVSRSKYHYVFGFNESCSERGKFSSLDLYPKSYEHLSKNVLSLIQNEFKKNKTQGCYDTKWGFEAISVANLDPLHPEHLDIWKINHDGNVIHLKDGSPIQY